MQQVTGFSRSNAVDERATIRSSDADIIDLGALLATLWRGKWIIGAVTSLAILSGGYYAYAVAVPIYTATSVVKLETQEQSVVDLESVVSGLSADSVTINSEIEVMRSRSLAGKVVDRLDLMNDPEFNASLQAPGRLESLKAHLRDVLMGSRDWVARTEEQQAALRRNMTVDALLERVSITNIPNSLVFRIQATSESPATAAEIADAVAELYILNQLDVKFEATQQATAWLTERVAELRIELEAAEAKLAAFSTETELVSPEALQGLERQLKELRDRIATTSEALAAQSDLEAALADARTRQQRATASGDSQLQRLLPRTESDTAVAQAFDTRFAQVTERARLEVERTTLQLAALRSSETELRARIDAQGDDLIALQQLAREAEASRSLYEYFLGRLKETAAQQGIQQADSRVLSSAVLPQRPTTPRKSLVLAMAALLGLMAGAAIVLLREGRNRSFRTPDALEAATGHAVLGQIPRIPVRSRRKVLEYLRTKTSSATAEAFRNLRTSVMLSNVDTPPKVILSTSALPGEGKTTNSIALAHNFVGMGKKVLLIEGDIRRRTLNAYFDELPAEGLASVISGAVEKEDVIRPVPEYGFHVLIGEKTQVNAADLFSSDRFQALIADLRNDFDVIIVDTPPVLVVPDARIISQEADAVLFTVKWDSTSRDQVQEALRLLRQGDQQITGLVLSQINPGGMKRYGYGGKYGAYGVHGSKYYVN
ncbi:polysaccharide biosynthesis tyrosine autokinase [Vannielia litorea]|uniref:non-specific protein-tyrosine kinase n=1 Tax=Vannielia litorea TaxID=1217970 RepID=A0A1N6G670_9RHOB|nr:polysaccharide biosynthesis tyrosine autokinase [Vannielia litorea]SIO02984.1 capsular exopolysaccharide family [Vannielia litorea]